MKGGHDLGGQLDMGPINPEAETEEPVFHADWERRVFALTLAAGMLGKWNIDESRYARERQEPLTYVKNSYYENWLEGLEKLLLEKELINALELSGDSAERRAVDSVNAPLQFSAPNSEVAQKILFSGASSLMDTESDPLFQIGDKVLVRFSETKGHTRAPRYAQGAIGMVSTQLGCHSYPDSKAKGIHEGHQLYTVIFQGSDLCGSEAEKTEVMIDLWEPYLERVPQ